ncbi:MAG: RNA 2',3'-cyclic phosphodiesterase [Gemmatales bacterium]|nr:MAG: RNA 2',3'-cyclic phosphodiesterase [Gemmatales bacterium]
MSRIRTFIAVDPDKAIRNRLVSLQESLAAVDSDIKWVEPENLHVTLLFLGEVEDRQLSEVCRIVQACADRHEAFLMTVENVGAFPNLHRPRVVWAGIGEGKQELCALHDELEIPMQDLGYRREERRYTPHITLGRIRNKGPASGLAQALNKKTGWKAGETQIREIHVMSSELTPQGPVYTVMSKAKLKSS